MFEGLLMSVFTAPCLLLQDCVEAIGDVPMVNATHVLAVARSSDLPLSVCSAYTNGNIPENNRGCYSKPCSTYGLVVGDWSACTVTCGGGTQTRPAK